jgi:hypothetical protein
LIEEGVESMDMVVKLVLAGNCGELWLLPRFQSTDEILKFAFYTFPVELLQLVLKLFFRWADKTPREIGRWGYIVQMRTGS